MASEVPPGVPHVQLTGVSKHFAGIRALEGVDFACRRGTIHAVLGENGAGKSTLIKIMSGVLRPDTGEMRLDGRPVAFANPSEADRAGIVCIFQELSLIPDLSVADNISHRRPAAALRPHRPPRPAPPRRGAPRPHRLRGRQPARARPRPVALAPPDGRDRQGDRPRPLGADPRRGDLGADRPRRRDRLRASSPTSRRRAWPRSSSRTACTRSRRSATRSRSSATAATSRPSPRARAARREIVRLMIGRDVEAQFPPKPAAPAPGAAPRRSRTSPGRTASRASTSTVGQGEIVGLGGLDGQGQKELLLALFGVLRGVERRGHRRRLARRPRLARRGQVRPRPASRSSPRTARPRA